MTTLCAQKGPPQIFIIPPLFCSAETQFLVLKMSRQYILGTLSKVGFTHEWKSYYNCRNGS